MPWHEFRTTFFIPAVRKIYNSFWTSNCYSRQLTAHLRVFNSNSTVSSSSSSSSSNSSPSLSSNSSSSSRNISSSSSSIVSMTSLTVFSSAQTPWLWIHILDVCWNAEHWLLMSVMILWQSKVLPPKTLVELLRTLLWLLAVAKAALVAMVTTAKTWIKPLNKMAAPRSELQGPKCGGYESGNCQVDLCCCS